MQNTEHLPSEPNPPVAPTEAPSPRPLAQASALGQPYGGKPSDAELDNRFRYHRPDMAKSQLHAQVTELTLALAKQLRDICPPGRNLSLALTELETVRMRANAAIACGQ